ncbi:LapA family protein [Novosphingopyxis sp. YJ-S2-01]|uniref:LapA family protein n=1 Tax=Novosphingopyxis sp. YJ-S2-01 TaxID=2794021 RepID=UPI0018DC0695|nr:LapA family protein [Novosphingopyxis sp. YJ-S2-01]MBH9537843.1 LapA family protein [Novosphingopyxis sp. YJ-S2-01]
MQFLKTLFWVALAVALVVFSANNWEPVSIGLWGGLRMDTKLPVLVIGAFLVGFLPLYLVYRTMLWRMRRRIATLEAANRPVTTHYEHETAPVSEPARPASTIDRETDIQRGPAAI